MKKINSLQITDTIVMVSPDQFGFNPQTAVTNVFQHKPTMKEEIIRDKAMQEFKNMVAVLGSQDITVLELPSRTDVSTPDAVFPNNWFTHHADNTLVLYPMLTPNRRAERQSEKLQHILTTVHMTPHIFDFTQEEKRGNILEGTGSMVFDRVGKTAFAIESSRTTKELFYIWCQKMQFEPFLFNAYSDKEVPIYHTNMFMSIGDGFAVYCPESISDDAERTNLEKKFQELHKELIPITLKQVYSFCGNILQVKTTQGDKKIILSETAYNAFTPKQKESLGKHGKLLPIPVPIIEEISGGSVRCMMAEIFPPN